MESNNTIYFSNAGYDIYKPPKASNWQCQIIGGPMGVVFTPAEGSEPNWFHRKMQELCFGFKWRKVK
jgi:hypothetical protein